MSERRARVPLDGMNLCFFSSYNDVGGEGLTYAIDYEDAEDAHFQLTEDQADKLERYLKANHNAADLPSGIQAYVAEHGFWGLEKLFEQAGICPRLFYFYDIDIE